MSTFRLRQQISFLFIGGSSLCALLSVLLLFYIIVYVFFQGTSYVNLDFFTNTTKPLGQSGGGAVHSLAGTMIMVGLASLIGIPVGLGAGIFVSEYASSRVGSGVRFLADVLSGVPSIVIGIFVYELIVVRQHHFSAFAGGVALAVIMLPIIARATEEMLKLVPSSQREAALALGISKWRTTLRVVLPVASGGLITGVLLAVARASGETAPLIFTSLGNQFFSTDLNAPMDSLPVHIYRFAIGPYDEWHQQAWAAAFVLILMVFSLSIVARVVLGRQNRG